METNALFLQVEYPFLRYNLFAYVYVVSFYEHVKRDPRYLEARLPPASFLMFARHGLWSQVQIRLAHYTEELEAG